MNTETQINYKTLITTFWVTYSFEKLSYISIFTFENYITLIALLHKITT